MKYLPGLLLGSLAAVAVAATVARAQTPLLETVPPAYREDYRAVLEEPGDLARIYKLARRAETDAAKQPAEAEDLFHLAIRLYERMLLINPTLTQVRLRLGEIHHKLRVYDISRAYLTRALEDPALPREARANVEGYLEDIDERLSRHRLSGSFLVGFRHQTNANAAPDDDMVLKDGEPRELKGSFTGRADQDFFGSLRLTHAYDPGWQGGQTLETSLSAYGVKQFDETEVDTWSGDLTSGPRFSLTSLAIRDATVRPHIVVRALGLDGALFSLDVGAGLDATKRFSGRLRSALELRAVQQFHNNTSERPDTDERDGPEVEGTASLIYRVFRPIELGGALLFRWNDADKDSRASLRYGGQLNGRVTYSPPFGLGTRQWSSGLTLAVTRTRFDAPDRDIDPDTRRKDNRYGAHLSTTVPLTSAFSLVGTAGYTRVDSNVRNFDYDNWAFSLGVAYRF